MSDLVKPPSAELVALVDRAAYYGKSTIADRTRKTYETEFRYFKTWAHGLGLETDPPAVATVAVYLGSLAMMRVGDELRRLREAKGLTLRGLADKVGLSAPFLSDVEHGRRRLSRLDAVAKALGVRVIHFLDVAGSCPHCRGTGFAIGATDGE